MNRMAPAGKARGLLRTHLWLVILAACMAGGAAAAAVTAKPLTYTSTAEVVVSPEETGSTPLRPDMGTERAIAQSGVVLDRAATAVQTDPGNLQEGMSVSVVLESLVLRISYTGRTPSDALLGATALSDAYVDYRNGAATDDVVTLVTPPALPASGSRGNVPLIVVLGLMAGLALGVAAAWMWDRLSDRVRQAEELPQRTGVPLLVRVPRWKSVGNPLPLEGPVRESFAYVAARLASMVGHDSGKTIVVTSPRAGAGTTSVACSTAAALAAQGKQVVLIAAHHEGLLPEHALGVVTSPGLRQVLARNCSLEEALHSTVLHNLSVVPSGGAPGERLELADLHLLLEGLERRAFVVIDAPPLLVSADSLLLTDVADLVVLVGDLRSGTRSDVRDALALLDDVGPRLAGWVANLPPRRRRMRGLPHWFSVSRRTRSSKPLAAGTQVHVQPEPSPASPAPDRRAIATMTGRPQSVRELPVASRSRTPARPGGRPVRAVAPSVVRRR